MVHHVRPRPASVLLALILGCVLVLALAQPAAAAPRDGVGEPLPLTATLHQITDRLQEALGGWIGNLWGRAATDMDPDGTPSSATVETPRFEPATPVSLWGRAANDMDPNGTPVPTDSQSSSGATSWGMDGNPYGG